MPLARVVVDHKIMGGVGVLPEVVAYRSQSDAEFGFRQLKDPHVVSFSLIHHWTDHNPVAYQADILHR